MSQNNTGNSNDATGNNELGIVTAVVQGFNTLSDIAYNAETPLSDNRIYDVAMRGTAQDRHVGNQLYDLFATGNGLWGESSREREIKDAVNYARNSGTDFSNYSRSGSIDTLINAWNPNVIQGHVDVPKNTYDNTDAYVAANAINHAIDLANYGTLSSFDEARDTINRQNLRQNMMNYFDEGGMLNEFNTGGSHEENPLGGIPQGIASDGLPNLVEEGEVRSDFDDSKIFNNQEKGYTLTEEDCEKYLLPKSVIGCNPAEAIKKLKKEYEERVNDPVSIATMKEWDNRVFAFQEDKTTKLEEKRFTKEFNKLPDDQKFALAQDALAQEQQEGIDLSQPMFAKGGKIHIKPKNRGKFTATKKRTGKTTEELTHSKNPLTRKRAIFAQNAKKWAHKHDIGGHLAALGMNLDIPPEEYPEIYVKNLPDVNITAGEPFTPIAINIPDRDEDYYQPSYMTTPISIPTSTPAPIPIHETSPKKDARRINKAVRDLDDNATSNNEWMRYMPAVGAGIGALIAGLQPVDYSYPNELRSLASQYKTIGAPSIGGYRRYNPYDVNLGDVENLALQTAALNANKGQNRATQGALNTAVIAKSQEASAKRNLAAQQANEANKLAVDTYNLGIDQTNANLVQAYDQLNQQINNNRINMLARAAQEADNSRTAWSNMLNTTGTNFFNQLGNVGRDEWNRNQFMLWLAQHPASAKAMGIEV